MYAREVPPHEDFFPILKKKNCHRTRTHNVTRYGKKRIWRQWKISSLVTTTKISVHSLLLFKYKSICIENSRWIYCKIGCQYLGLHWNIPSILQMTRYFRLSCWRKGFSHHAMWKHQLPSLTITDHHWYSIHIAHKIKPTLGGKQEKTTYGNGCFSSCMWKIPNRFAIVLLYKQPEQVSGEKAWV